MLESKNLPTENYQHFRHNQKGVLKLISYFLVIFMILKLSKSNGMLFMRQIMILEIQNNDLELIL